MVLQIYGPLENEAEKGVVVRWFCEVSDRVAKGEPLGEIESEKVTLTIEAPEDGIVRAILVPVGGELDNHTVLLHLEAQDLYGVPSDVARRLAASHDARTRSKVDAPRCRFCETRLVAGRVDCPRCGAPA